MKALIREAGSLRLADLPDPCPGHGQARVRVHAAGICATDLHILSGKVSFDGMPRVLGHEIAGVVDVVGDAVPPELIGMRVAVDPVVGCGLCRWCRSGRKLLCRDGGELGTTGGDGGYAEFVTIPTANLHILPPGLPFEAGALIEPLNCTYGAFLKAQPRPGESVLVLGSGPAGLLFVQLARAWGCSPVLLVGGGAPRLRLGARLGSVAAWDHRDPGINEQVLGAVAGEGPDIVVEASGADAAVGRAIELVRGGGRVVLYGISGANRPNIPSDLIVTKDLTVVTGIGSPLLWDEVVQLAAAGREDLASLVSHRFPLHEHAEALSVAADVQQSVKVVLTP
jgi:threonine dehydrogenase-like Zn-dependent dehydrogenase